MSPAGKAVAAEVLVRVLARGSALAWADMMPPGTGRQLKAIATGVAMRATCITVAGVGAPADGPDEVRLAGFLVDERTTLLAGRQPDELVLSPPGGGPDMPASTRADHPGRPGNGQLRGTACRWTPPI